MLFPDEVRGRTDVQGPVWFAGEQIDEEHRGCFGVGPGLRRDSGYQLKWDVVVEVVDRRAAAGRCGRAGGARLIAEAAAGVAFVVAAFDRRAAGAAGAARPVEDREPAAKARQDDLGRVALLTRNVGPFKSLQRALGL